MQRRAPGRSPRCRRAERGSTDSRYRVPYAQRRPTPLARALRIRAAGLRRAYEPVADARLVEQVARARGIGLDLAPQVRHVHVEVVRLLAVRGAPDRAQDRGMREQLALVLRE